MDLIDESFIKLTVKLSDLDLNTSLCDWIQDSSPADLKW